MFLRPAHVQEPLGWTGHIPFASWLIEQAKPKLFVELGTHSGNSYFAFCQAVAHNNLSTTCYAVDTWQGDDHAGYYGDSVFQMVSNHNREFYERFSFLMRMTFDEALPCFSNGSIDILHIDGLHTYEAVKHDFYSWLPKMSPRGIVLLHDINVREKEFGVWKLWEELRFRYREISFLHSHGLGVLFTGQQQPAVFRKLLKEWEESPKKQLFRTLFESLGTEITLSAANASLHAHAAEQDVRFSSLNRRYQKLEAEKNELAQSHQRLLTSSSWKATRPIRALSASLRQYSRAVHRKLPKLVSAKNHRQHTCHEKTLLSERRNGTLVIASSAVSMQKETEFRELKLLLKALFELDCSPCFLSLCPDLFERYRRNVQHPDIPCILKSGKDAEKFLASSGNHFSVFVVFGSLLDTGLIVKLRSLAPSARIIFTIDKAPAAKTAEPSEILPERELPADADVIVTRDATRETFDETTPALKNIRFTPPSHEKALEEQNRRNFLLLGDLMFSSNTAGAHHFIREVWPLVRKEFKNATLLLPPCDPVRHASFSSFKHQGICVLKSSEELRTQMVTCRAAAAVLKPDKTFFLEKLILDAAASGAPCILSSPVKNALFNFFPDNGIETADDAQTLAEKTINLSKNKTFRNQVIKHTMTAFENQYYAAGKNSLKDLLSTLFQDKP